MPKTDKHEDRKQDVDPTPGPVVDNQNKDGRFRPVKDFSSDYDKALEASKKEKEDAREKLAFTKEGREAAAEKKERYDAISKVVGYTTHPDTPVKLSTEEVTPSLNDAEAKAKGLDVPVGTV